MKKVTAALLALLLSCTMLASSAFAAEQQVSVQVDGEQIQFGGRNPVIEEGTTLVPAVPLFEALGLALEYEDGHVTGTRGDVVIELWAGRAEAAVNGEPVKLTATPRIVNGSTYLPVRFVGEAVGFEVLWEPAARTVALVAQDAQEGGKGFLWKVEHNGNTVYLLGSMHLADDSFYPLHDSIEGAFEQADYLGVEVDVSNAASPEVQELTMSIGAYQDGTTLKDHLSEETYAKLGEVLTANGLQAEALDQFKPWMVDMTLQALQAMASGFQGQVGIDQYFLTKAIERKIPIVELESFESQLNMFDGFSLELQETMLMATLEQHDLIGQGVDALADMWKEGDDEALMKVTNSMKFNEEYYKAMIVDRNIGMAEKIAGYLNGENQAVYLIVVGAAHMPGEAGIVELLETEGFTVERQ